MNQNMLMLCLVVCGCGEVAERPAGATSALTRCEVALPGTPVRVAAGGETLVVGLDDGTLLRGVGAGCALHFERSGELGELLDVDAAGDVYVMVGDALRAARFPDTFGDLVARVSAEGEATRVVGAGRGIWGFGVAPSGKVMWVSACGPTGVLSTADLTPRLDVVTPWERGAAVLSDDTTFWSTTVEACTERGSTCTLALVQETPQATRTLATMPSAVAETPLLARCGEGVCVALEGALQQFSADGTLTRGLERDALALSERERVLSLAMTRSGLYVLSDGEGGRRLHFTP